jgi:hypothetical protein
MNSSTDYANYIEQRQAFLELLRPECRNRVLLIRGKSGAGKTTLISTCKKDVCKPVQCIFIQCKNTTLSVAEIFSRTGKELGWQSLSRFTEQVAALCGININIEKNWQVGTGNSIHTVLNVENPADRDERRVHLTDAWFEDIRVSEQPVVIVIDTYEKANPEVKSWISGHFLASVANIPNIRVAIAGQEVPDHQEAIDWGDCCEFHELNGVWEADHWLPVFQGMKRRIIGESDPRSFLSGICYAFQGSPDAIMTCIKGLPPL